MMILEPRKLVSNVDKMAYNHLVSIGAIIPKGAGRPKSTAARKIPKSRVGWKRLDAAGWSKGSKLCVQCGRSEGNDSKMHPYGMRLCGDCLRVHMVSVDRGLRSSDDITF